MSRFNHLLFQECIEVFRNNGQKVFIHDSISKEIYGVILSPFKISKEWDLKHCIIYPTQEVVLEENYRAYVSMVKISERIDLFKSHLYTNALCSILSTVAEAPFKSPRDMFYLRELPNVTHERLIYFAMTHPVFLDNSNHPKEE
jgi:hypothetical protein